MRRLGALLLAVIAATASTAPADAAKTEQFYVVMAHPDDELQGWNVIERIPDSAYQVWVLFTRGEGTNSCVTPELSRIYEPGTTGAAEFVAHFEPAAGPLEDSSGVYKYEGPDSPAGEPDQGERHPFGFPWAGQRSVACKRARVASWHWFLDDMHGIDGTGTNLGVAGDPWRSSAYRGRFCPDRKEARRRRRSRAVDGRLTCADVWANADSARVVFEYEDQGFLDGQFLPSRFTPADVTTAIQQLRRKRAKWGLPRLPEIGIHTPASDADGVRCPTDGSSDHKQVLDAIRYTEQHTGPQSGAMACPDDPYGDGADVSPMESMNPATLVAMNLVEPVTGRRIGPVVVNYGWLFPGYAFGGCLNECQYWTRRG